jgi:NADH pyrophosphatase NudC (nudix superfamily)
MPGTANIAVPGFEGIRQASHRMEEKMTYCPQCGGRLGRITVEGLERKACVSRDCDYVFWDNPIPVVAALVEKDDRVLLVRNKAWPEKIYGLVTGFLERGETPEAGLLREVEEEIGLAGEIVEFIGYYSFVEMNQLILAFHVRVSGSIVLGEELADYRLIAPERLRPWPFGTGHAVADWLKRR